MSGEKPNRNIEVAYRYDAETRHTPAKLCSEPHFLDWENQPLVYKIYQGLQQISLEPDWSGLELDTLDILSNLSAPAPDAEPPTINRQTLSRILYHAYGQTARKGYPGGAYYLRAAPSAGALYPVELYSVAASVNGLPDGVYHFDTGQGRLTCLREGDFRETLAACCSNPAAVRSAPVTFLLSAISWRSSWKYRSRAYRYCALDCGHLAGNLLPIGSAEGLLTMLICNFLDGPVNKLLGLDEDHEAVFAIVPLGSKSIEQSDWESPPRSIPKIKPRYRRLSRSDVDYPLIRKIHRATRLTSPTDLPESTSSEQRDDVSGKPTERPTAHCQPRYLGEAILNRRSSRDFIRAPVPFDVFISVLRTSFAPFLSDLRAPLSITPHVVVNAVSEMSPGVYSYDQQSCLLQQKKEGNFRNEISRLCLEQSLAGNSAAAIVLLVDLDDVLNAFGNRGYRISHIYAGIVGQFVYVAARSLGIGCSGIGAFYDEDVVRFLGYDPEKTQVLYILVCGMESPDVRLMP